VAEPTPFWRPGDPIPAPVLEARRGKEASQMSQPSPVPLASLAEDVLEPPPPRPPKCPA
jgi:hypothetical protein